MGFFTLELASGFQRRMVRAETASLPAMSFSAQDSKIYIVEGECLTEDKSNISAS